MTQPMLLEPHQDLNADAAKAQAAQRTRARMPLALGRAAKLWTATRVRATSSLPSPSAVGPPDDTRWLGRADDIWPQSACGQTSCWGVRFRA